MNTENCTGDGQNEHVMPQDLHDSGCPQTMSVGQHQLPQGGGAGDDVERGGTGDEKRWFAMRTTYCRELRFRDYCQSVGMECFVPMRVVRKKVRTEEGRVCERRVQEPAIHNIAFVLSRRNELDELVLSHRLDYLRYYYDHTSGEPLVIPAGQMRNFMSVACVEDENIVWLEARHDAFAVGEKVRVVEGPFAGVEGYVKRVKGQQRVIIQLADICSIATAYVPKAYLVSVNREQLTENS